MTALDCRKLDNPFGPTFVARVDKAKGIVKPVTTSSIKMDANHVITSVTVMSDTNPKPGVNPVVKVTIKPGYRSGVANVKGQSQDRDLPPDDPAEACWPQNANIPLS